MHELYGSTDVEVGALIQDLMQLLMLLEASQQGNHNAKWLTHGVLMYRLSPQPEPGDDLNEFRSQEERHYLSLLQARVDDDLSNGGEDSAMAVMELLHRARNEASVRRLLVTLLKLIGYPPFTFKEVLDGSPAPHELQDTKK